MLQERAPQQLICSFSLDLKSSIGHLRPWIPFILFLSSAGLYYSIQDASCEVILAAVWINSLPGFIRKNLEKIQGGSSFDWLNHLPVPSMVIEGSTGKIIASNTEADHLLGLSRSVTSPYQIQNFLLGDDQKEVWNSFLRRQTSQHSCIFRSNNGKSYITSLRWKEISPDPDKLYLIQGFGVQPVSKNRIKELQESSAQEVSDTLVKSITGNPISMLSGVLEHFPQAIAITSPDGGFCWHAGDRLASLFELPVQSQYEIPRWWEQGIVPDDQYKANAFWKELSQSGTAETKVTVVGKGKNVRQVIWRGIMGRDSSGHPEMAYHYFLPASAPLMGSWSAAVEELARKESGIGLWAWDRQHSKVDWSPEFYVLHQISHQEQPDMNLPFPFITEATRFDLKFLLETLDGAHLPLSTEYQIELPDGTLKDFILGVSEVRKTPEGGTSFLAGFIKDVTSAREEDRVQKKLLNEIRSNQQLIKEFSTGLSHRLRVPVAQIQGILSIIAREGGTPSPSHMNLLQQCTEEVDHALHEMNELINMHKGEEGKAESYTWQELWKPVSMEFQRRIIELRASVMVDFSGAGKVTGIKEKLQGILGELLNNAIRFREEDRLLEIHAYTERIGNMIWFHLQDNGTGVNLDEHDHSPFELYKRFHRNSGNGFGLYLSRTWADNMNGRMEMTSIKGEGTRVSLGIPVEPGE